MAPEVKEGNYVPYDETRISVEFSDNVATTTWILKAGGGYGYTIKPSDLWPHIKDHVYYFSYEINPDMNGVTWGVEFAGGVVIAIKQCSANTWDRLSCIGTNIYGNKNTRFYIPNARWGTENLKVGSTCKVRNPIYIDLTLMYGEGKEPKTVEEFEKECVLNGIDLCSFYPRDIAGTSRTWFKPDSASALEEIRRNILSNSPHIEFATGTTASFKTDMVVPLKECKISFSPTQEGTGDPSPTNVRPIKGLNRLDVRHTNRNIVPLDGWTANNGNDYGSKTLTNSYGTTLSTMDNSGTVTVTQSQYSESGDPTNYTNGYFCLISESLEFGKRYNVSFDLTDITNPLNVPLETIRLLSPSGGGSVIGGSVVYSNNRYVCRGYLHNKYTSTPNRNIDRIEIRNCGMSFTISNVLITCADDTSVDYEAYQGESFIIDSPLEGKNLADVYGVSAITFATIYQKPSSSNSYGTTIAVNGDSIVVTQSQAPNTTNKGHYTNGYLCIGVNGMKYGEKYRVSFKITDIINNPLDAQLSDIKVCEPSGSEVSVSVYDNRVVGLIKYNHTTRQYFTVRNCGMSFTLSEFMVTVESETDQTYEPYKKTMYGGYVDLVNKEFVQEWACETNNGGTWYVTSGGNAYQWGHSKCSSHILDIKSTHWKTTQYNTNEDLVGININGALYIGRNFWNAANITPTPETVAAYFQAQKEAGTPFYCCCKLLEPIHHPLTADILRSFRGNNRIWSGDCNVETKYWSHIKENKIQITWNQLSRVLNTSNWRIQNANYGTATFENGIAKVTVTQDTTNQYNTAICNTNNAVTNWDESHLYYFRQEIKSSDDRVYVSVFGSTWRKTLYVKANEWTELKVISTPNVTTTTGSSWINYPATNCSTGQTHECRRVNLIDLTLMFGAGNEPATAEEFEQICMKNGVDLIQAQPYDAGTPLTWIV